MAEPPMILLVDDEEFVQKLLTYPLEREGFRVVYVLDGEEAFAKFVAEEIDFVVLDLMLSKLDGFEVCKRLRSDSFVSIIMLTARDDELDKVLGLELGADDYITKFFSIREFRSRVRVFLRCAAVFRPGEREDEELVEAGGVRIDVSRRTVGVCGDEVQLTFVEFELLRTLAFALGRVFSCRQLLERLRGGADYREFCTIDVHVCYLREKIERDLYESELILTVRGVGYRFREQQVRMWRSVIRGIWIRFFLALVFVVVGVLGVVYLIVVFSFERELVNAKLDQFEQDVRTVARSYGIDTGGDQDFAERSAVFFFSRVVIYYKLEDIVLVLGDLSILSSRDVERDRVALRVAAIQKLQRGTIECNGWLFAEVGLSVGPRVVFLSDLLADLLSSLYLIERRFLIAGLLGLLLAVVAGFVLATMHAWRIRRLERAAERIAGGAFDEPVVDAGHDELAELAAVFERMRVRLEMLDRACREFIANALHELRMSLFLLAGFLELMADEDVDEPTRQEFLETMREQVDRLAKFATDLFDFFRLDVGRMRVEHELVDLAAVAQLVAEEFAPVAEWSNYLFEIAVDGEPIARADELRVLQVFCALVDNALVYMPPGSKVMLRAYADREHAYLEVEDDGSGIPAEHVFYVFDRFYWAEGGIVFGSGLGLAIVRELVIFMYGDVELESHPGWTIVCVVLGVALTSVAVAVVGARVFT